MRYLHDGTAVALSRSKENLVLKRRVLSIVALFIVFMAGESHAHGQTAERKVELGFHYTSINLGVFDSKEAGGGVRLSYNINNYLSVEAEGNLFEFSIGDGPPTDDVLAAQGLVGAKAGLRNRHVGVFAKIRPGVVNFPSLRVRRRFCNLLQPCEDAGRSGNRFALDTGAVLELYPTDRIIVRLDIGDTMIRFSDDSFFKSSAPVRIDDGFRHNFQFAVGVGFRF